MKTLEFIYQDTQIHFLVNPLDKNVMVNATEMSKIFNKRTSDYLQNTSTKAFLNTLELTLKSVNSDIKLLENRGHMGYYFHRLVALDFAAWLDVKFRVWMIITMDDLIFNNFNKRSKILKEKTSAQLEIEKLEKELIDSETYQKIQELKKQQSSATKKLNALDKDIVNEQLKLFK